MNRTSVYAIETHAQHPDDSVLYVVDFTGRLTSGEELTGTPAASITPSTGVTLADVAVSSATAINGQGDTVEAYKSATVRVSGLSAPENYVLTVTCDTTLGNRLTVQCPMIGQE